MAEKTIFSRDLTGMEYLKFVEVFANRWSAFEFYIRSDSPGLSSTGQDRLQSLKHELISLRTSTTYHGEDGPLHDDATMDCFRYAVTESSIRQLLALAPSFFGWVLPNSPEDIVFFSHDGQIWLRVISHESFIEFCGPAEDRQRINELFPRLLVSLDEFAESPPENPYLS